MRLLSDLALAQLQSGDAGAAVATASRAYRIQPASPLAAQAFGLALAAGGRRPNTARALLRQAQRSIGDTPLQAEAPRRPDARPPGGPTARLTHPIDAPVSGFQGRFGFDASSLREQHWLPVRAPARRAAAWPAGSGACSCRWGVGASTSPAPRT